MLSSKSKPFTCLLVHLSSSHTILLLVLHVEGFRFFVLTLKIMHFMFAQLGQWDVFCVPWEWSCLKWSVKYHARLCGSCTLQQVIDMILRMRRETQSESPSVMPQIDNLILLDRSVDLMTPMLSQLTYEGLIDEIFGIQNCKYMCFAGSLCSGSASRARIGPAPSLKFLICPGTIPEGPRFDIFSNKCWTDGNGNIFRPLCLPHFFRRVLCCN